MHNLAYVLPYFLFQRLSLNLSVVAYALASKPVAVSSCAPIVTKIPELMPLARLTRRFAIEGIAAECAAGQTLQKVA